MAEKGTETSAENSEEVAAPETVAFFQVNDVEVPTPQVPSTVGANGLAINQLLASTGDVTLDYGFGNTAAATSKITYIDGDRGILRYRGYPIEQLARNSSFLEVAFLLIYGEAADRFPAGKFHS